MVFKKGDIIGWRDVPEFIGIVVEADDRGVVALWLDDDGERPNEKTIHGKRDETLILIVSAEVSNKV
jgi:hypothetical protein